MAQEIDLKKLFDALRQDLRQDLTHDAEIRFQRLEKRIAADNALNLQNANRLDTMASHIEYLWRKVNGSEPPPANVDPSLPPPGQGIAHKITSHDMDLAGLHGNVIAVDSKVGEMKEELGLVKSELQKQSFKMGIDKRGLDWLHSPEGVKTFATFIAAITGLVTAIGTAYALMTGRLPMPTTPPPQPPAYVEPHHAP